MPSDPFWHGDDDDPILKSIKQAEESKKKNDDDDKGHHHKDGANDQGKSFSDDDAHASTVWYAWLHISSISSRRS